jgi:hypothetical protein
MDPITLAIAGAVATGIATGAGESTGTALGVLVGRIRERLAGRAQTLDTPESAAAALHEEFAGDPAFELQCRDLWNQVTGDGVSNTFHGQARTVVQARDVHGGLTVT